MSGMTTVASASRANAIGKLPRPVLTQRHLHAPQTGAVSPPAAWVFGRRLRSKPKLIVKAPPAGRPKARHRRILEDQKLRMGSEGIAVARKSHRFGHNGIINQIWIAFVTDAAGSLRLDVFGADHTRPFRGLAG